MKKGFTLLEVIIVIIIVGVLTSLAMPKLFSMVEGAKAAEAISAIATIRSAMERCYLMRGGRYGACALFNALDIENPGNAPGSNFNYQISPSADTPESSYMIYVTNKDDPLKFIAMGYKCNPGPGFKGSGYWCLGSSEKINWQAHNIYSSFIPK